MEIFGSTHPFASGIELALDETTGEGWMQKRVAKYQVRLNAKPRRRLEALVRRRSPAHWKVTRARIVLLSHKGNGIDEIACALSVDHQVVRRWLKRYLAHGFDGLSDRPKTGRPTEIEPRGLAEADHARGAVAREVRDFSAALVGPSAPRFSGASLQLADQSHLGEPIFAVDGAQAPSIALLAQPQ